MSAVALKGDNPTSGEYGFITSERLGVDILTVKWPLHEICMKVLYRMNIYNSNWFMQ